MAEKDADADVVSPLQIRNAANHILHVMCTKVPSAFPVLWPYLLEIINDEVDRPAVDVEWCCCLWMLVLMWVRTPRGVV